MGRLAAIEMRQQADLIRAIGWHLGSNHYPPIDARWIPIVHRLVLEARGLLLEVDISGDRVPLDDWLDTHVEIEGRDSRWTRRAVMDGMHLWDFATTFDDTVN